MPIVVKAISENDYKVWLTYQPQSNKNKISFAILTPRTMSKTELMTLGKSKYETNCLACHQADGHGIPPMFPALKGNPVVISDKIKRHVEIILNGVPKSAMQPYAKQLTDEEIAAIATYESNAWGNNANKLIQPQEVAKIRSDNNIFLNAKLRNMP
jgi:cytochrome c oxidase subunit 2